jgi:hypothetical protein
MSVIFKPTWLITGEHFVKASELRRILGPMREVRR